MWSPPRSRRAVRRVSRAHPTPQVATGGQGRFAIDRARAPGAARRTARAAGAGPRLAPDRRRECARPTQADGEPASARLIERQVRSQPRSIRPNWAWDMPAASAAPRCGTPAPMRARRISSPSCGVQLPGESLAVQLRSVRSHADDGGGVRLRGLIANGRREPRRAAACLPAGAHRRIACGSDQRTLRMNRVRSSAGFSVGTHLFHPAGFPPFGTLGDPGPSRTGGPGAVRRPRRSRPPGTHDDAAGADPTASIRSERNERNARRAPGSPRPSRARQ